MEYFVTNQCLRHERKTANEQHNSNHEMKLVKVYADIRFQNIVGFGGALTESSAYVFSRMSAKNQKKLLDMYFGKSGNCYNLGRLPIQSCDFSLRNRAYVESGDVALETFSIADDAAYQIPLIKSVLMVNPHMQFLASPWSPPAFMKTNKEMNHGGQLLKEHYTAWAKIMVKYLLAYRSEGIVIDRVTVQNEPAAVQTWDSCIYSAEQEGVFAANHLRKELDAAGLSNVKIFIWDHNKDRIIERCSQTFAVPGAYQAVDGIAFHWYTGDHFPALDYIYRQYPDKEILFTEGCVEYLDSPGRGEVNKAESYAHSLIGDFNAGMNGFIDWNIILDEQGGPNHVKNFCEAPIMCNVAADTINVRLSYYYIGHFSRYVKPGARRLLSSSYTRDLECVAFENPGGEQIVVILNETAKGQRFALQMGTNTMDITLEPHSIMTAVAVGTSQ